MSQWYGSGVMKIRIFGKLVERSSKAPIWRATRFPFSGSILETSDGRFTWRLKLHPSFQSTDILLDGSASTAEEAEAELTGAAKRNVKSLLWFEDIDDED